jgi:hypothetical protein
MQTKYGVREWINHATPFQLKKYLEFRLAFIKEEYDETREALIEEDAEEIVDGLIDICVVAIGTLDAMGVNAHTAWDNVFDANMTKEVGIKEERPNPLGLPDLIKPDGWVNPTHEWNHGLIPYSFKDEIKAKANEFDEYPVGHYTPGPGPLDGTQAKIDWTKDSEYVRLYGTKVEKI